MNSFHYRFSPTLSFRKLLRVFACCSGSKSGAINAGILDAHSFKSLDGGLPVANADEMVMVKCGPEQQQTCMFSKGLPDPSTGAATVKVGTFSRLANDPHINAIVDSFEQKGRRARAALDRADVLNGTGRKRAKLNVGYSGPDPRGNLVTVSVCLFVCLVGRVKPVKLEHCRKPRCQLLCSG
jgi:hypothetical protein